MTTLSQGTKRKLSLLQLAEELGNVSRACKVMGYHRDTFYEGAAGLPGRRRGCVGGRAARTAQPAPQPRCAGNRGEDPRVLPALPDARRPARVQRASPAGTEVGPSGVRGVWSRANLLTRYQRLMRLEREAQGDTLMLSESQIKLLERHSADFRLRHIEASRPGELLNQDTFYWGTMKGVGKIYVQIVVDVFCSLAFAKVYTAKMPITAAVLPFYEALGVTVGAVLTDNGREFCGVQEKHPYELLLAMEGIEHRTTKVRCPRTNGFVERMNRTLLDECFRVKGRTTTGIQPSPSCSATWTPSWPTTTSSAAIRATGSRVGHRRRR